MPMLFKLLFITIIVVKCEQNTKLRTKIIENCFGLLKLRENLTSVETYPCGCYIAITNAVKDAILDYKVEKLDVTSSLKTIRFIHSMFNANSFDMKVIYRDFKKSLLTFTNATGSHPVNKYTLLFFKAVAKICSTLRWTYVVFLYDAHSDIQPWSFLLLMASNKIQAMTVNVSDHQQVKTFFERQSLVGFNVITDCEDLDLLADLTKMSGNNFLSYPHRWIFITTSAYNKSLEFPFQNSWRYLQLYVSKVQTSFGLSMCTTNVCKVNVSCVDISWEDAEETLRPKKYNLDVFHHIQPTVNCKLFVWATKYSGIDWDILNTVIGSLQSDYKGFHYSVQMDDDNRLKLNPWQNLISKIYSQQTQFDMVMPFGHLSSDVMNNRLGFSVPAYEVVYGIVSVRSISVDSFGDYARPMRGEFNKIFLSVILVATITLSLSYYFSPYSNHNKEDKDDSPIEHTYCYSLFVSFYLIIAQAHDGFPNYLSARIMYFSVLLAGFLYLQYYAAVLMSFLTVRAVRPSFRNIKDLTEQENYRIGADNSYDIVGILNESNNEVFRKLANKIMSDPEMNLFFEPEDAIDRILTERFAYLTPINKMEPILRSNCRLAVIVPEVVRLTKHVIFKPNFPFKHLFSKKINQMKSSGSIKRLYEKHYPNILNVCDSETAVLGKVSYTTVHPVFNLLALMVTTGHLIFILEMTIDSARTKWKEFKIKKVKSRAINVNDKYNN